MDSLKASATLTWNGYHGRIEGDSGALLVNTATQAELGGPGGESNPEELFSAALANCFTSTLTGMARAREFPLGEITPAARGGCSADARPYVDHSRASASTTRASPSTRSWSTAIGRRAR